MSRNQLPYRIVPIHHVPGITQQQAGVFANLSLRPKSAFVSQKEFACVMTVSANQKKYASVMIVSVNQQGNASVMIVSVNQQGNASVKIASALQKEYACVKIVGVNQ
jgi:hypothetical protein